MIDDFPPSGGRRAGYRAGVAAAAFALVAAGVTTGPANAADPASQAGQKAAPSRSGTGAARTHASGGTSAGNAPPVEMEKVIVTGTRVLNRKASQSTSPIDVISNGTLTRSGAATLTEQLVHVNPAINVKAMGQDTAALTAEIRLRGLNPNDTLVLVDGIRRHDTSNIVADAGAEQGATGADLNMIPAAAIDHIEVLRDGAAAQYGSDAIAGVVNIITKKDSEGFSASAETGANANNGDGWLYQLDADGGAKFGKDGYVHVSGQIYHKDFFVQPAVDDRAAIDHFPADSNKILGVPEETRETMSIASGVTLVPDLWGGLQGFSLITYGHRHGEAYENYRTPEVLPQIYPEGFSPIETDEENDYAATLGVKADDFYGFHVDLSSTYGADETDVGNKDTANPNLYYDGAEPGDPDYARGPGFTPTTVLAQVQRTGQWTNDLNFVRLFHLMATPLNVAFGGEHRLDTYDLGAGNPPSWEVGGTQGFAGLRPQNAGSWSRDVYAAYVDLDSHPVPKLDVDVAGRFEHYTDFGNTENGKISSRYDFTRWLAARGTISTGFRAPTLAEEHFSALNVSPTGASGDLAVDSTAAQAIGAVPLKPERSTNASGGFVLEPLPHLSVMVDVYQINIRDRIVGAGGVVGQQALDAIELTGASIPAGAQVNDISAFYFANGASTRTQGLDLDAAYNSYFGDYGTVVWTLGIDLNRTRLHHNGTDAFGNPFLTAQGVGYVTTAFPRSKMIGDALWRKDRWDVNVRETRWGQTTNEITYQDLAPPALQYSGTQFYQFNNTPVWTSDLEVGYQISARWHLAVGGENLFNEQPRRLPIENAYLGVQYFDIDSAQLPLYGGFYYGRVNYRF